MSAGVACVLREAEKVILKERNEKKEVKTDEK